jgi:DNA-binding transcriptional ArsR family regulator
VRRPSKSQLRKTLAALSDPTRLRIVESIGIDRKTASSLARSLGVEKNRLYYHLRILERVGIIEVVDSVHEGRLPERRFALAPGQGPWGDELALSGDAEARALLAAATLTATGVELQAALRASTSGSDRERMASFSRGLVRTTPEVMQALSQQVADAALAAWAHAGDPRARDYRFTFAAYEPIGETKQEGP